MERLDGDRLSREPSGRYTPYKDIFRETTSPRSPLSTRSPDSESIDLDINGGGPDTSIEQLYNNVCDMQSSDQSPSRRSFLSYGEESRIDSELRFYAGGGVEAESVKAAAAAVVVEKQESGKNSPGKSVKRQQPKRLSSLAAAQDSEKPRKPPSGKTNDKVLRKAVSTRNAKNSASGSGSNLLKQTRDMISSGENPQKVLELGLRAMRSFETSTDEKPNLELVMCLHVVAALYCALGRYTDAIPVLERSIQIPSIDDGQNHALAKFAGCMQLGDTYAMLGQIENSILCYTAGLEIQRQVLGEKDLRFGETCRYVAEAHVQAFQFEEAEKLCQLSLNLHKENGSSASASPQEAADRRLMGLICDSKGDYEAALEHYVLASVSMAANGQDTEVGAVDCSIGDAYLSLARYDEAIFAYQKAITMFKSTKGDNHPSVGSVYVRLADLYNKIGKVRESKSYCENALRIYNKPVPGSSSEEIARGFADVSSIFETMNEPGEAIKLLQKALSLYGNVPGQQSTIAGMEAQMGVLYYILGNYPDSYKAFKSAIAKFREIGEKKSAVFGIALNQMGLTCVQLCAINEAADLFEEARTILESEYGPYHQDTLGVYSNLAGTYDAMGRSDDAIEILDYVVGMREEKLGTANPDVDEEKRRLSELLKENGRVRKRKSKSLEILMDSKQRIGKEAEPKDV